MVNFPAWSPRTLVNLIAVKKRGRLVLVATVLCFAVTWLLMDMELKGNVQNLLGDIFVVEDESSQRLRIDRENIDSSIFFLETSGLECLTRRQICTVESTARANLDLPIRVIFVTSLPQIGKAAKDDPSTKGSHFRDCTATANLLSFPNVAFHNQSFAEIAEDSLLKNLSFTGSFNRSSFPTFHLSDGLRIVVLKKYGGLYLDLDCIVFRSLKDIQSAVGMKDYFWLENGVIAFEANHPFLTFYEDMYVKRFSHDIYGANGPPLLASAIREYCNITAFFPSTYYCRNSTITLRPPHDFYFVHYDLRGWFYDKNFPKYADLLVKENYLSHVYDNEEGKAPPETLYAKLAKEFCPTAYQ